METWQHEASAAVTVAAAEAAVADPVTMVESLICDVGEGAASAVLGLIDGAAADAFDLLGWVVDGPGGVARLRLASCSVAAVRLAAGSGAASLWLRLPDPLLEWETPGLVIAARAASEAEPAVLSSAESFIAEMARG